MKTKYGNKYEGGGKLAPDILSAGIGAITPMLTPDAFSTKANSLKTVSSSLMGAAPGLLAIPGAGPFLAGGAVLGGAVTSIIGNNAQKRDDSIAQAAQYRPNYMSYGGKMYAEGGGMPSPDQLTAIMSGGSHEQNSQGGVPVGQDAQGTPNLVEEGETILNSEQYVFSDRIEIEKETAIEFALPRKLIGKTFAEGSKFLAVSKGYENDPYSVSTSKKMLDRLMMAQEQIRQEMEAEQQQAEQGGNQFATGGFMDAENAELMPEESPVGEETPNPYPSWYTPQAPEIEAMIDRMFGEDANLVRAIIKFEGGSSFDKFTGQSTAGQTLTGLTLKEVYEEAAKWKAAQREKGVPEDQISTAAGAGQFIKETGLRWAQKAGLSLDDKFTPENQLKMLKIGLDEIGLQKYKTQKMSRDKFLENFSSTWAAFPKDDASLGSNGKLANVKYDVVEEVLPSSSNPGANSRLFAEESNPSYQGDIADLPNKEAITNNIKKSQMAGSAKAGNMINYTPTPDQLKMQEEGLSKNNQGAVTAGEISNWKTRVGEAIEYPGTTLQYLFTGEQMPNELKDIPFDERNMLDIPLLLAEAIAVGAATGVYGVQALSAIKMGKSLKEVWDTFSKAEREATRPFVYTQAMARKGDIKPDAVSPYSAPILPATESSRLVGKTTLGPINAAISGDMAVDAVGREYIPESPRYSPRPDINPSMGYRNILKNAAFPKKEPRLNTDVEGPNPPESYPEIFESLEKRPVLNTDVEGPKQPEVYPDIEMPSTKKTEIEDTGGRHYMRYAPIAANLANMISTGIAGPETASPYLTNNRFQYNPVDMRHIEEMLRTEQRGLQNRLQNTRGNMGQSQQMNLSSSMPYFSALSEARLKSTMANNELLNRKSEFEYRQAAANNQAKFVTDDINARNRAAYDNAMRSYLAAMGEGIGGIGRENWMMENADKLSGQGQFKFGG